MSQLARLTISLPRDMIVFADKIAKERQISRSKVISACLEDFAEQRKLIELQEGYKAMAKENKEVAEITFELQRRVLPEWK